MRRQATLLFLQTTALWGDLSLAETGAKGPIYPMKLRPQTDALF